MLRRFLLSFLALLAVQAVSGFPTHQPLSKRDTKFTLKKPKAFAQATELKTSDNVITLKKTGAKSRSSSVLLSDAASGTTELSPVESGGAYGADVRLRGQPFTLIFDTGSSDLWVAQSGFQCVNGNGRRVPEARCDFGPLFSGDFQEGKVPNENILIQYGSGEAVTGSLGYEDVTIAGVTVDHQEIGSIDLAYFIGDGIISGILGFAYSSLTSAYPGNNYQTDNPATNNIHYTNFLGHAIAQGKIAPMFSLALERGANGGTGQLALGGLPTISFNHDFTSVPLEMIEFGRRHPIEKTHFTFYTINLDGVVVNGNAEPTGFPVIVDSGTFLTYLSPQLAKAINQAYNPPSQFVESEGYWENKCNATPPSFAFTIGGTNFQISSAELLIPKSQGGYDPSTGLCITGIQQTTAKPYVLGELFLKNVVAVFDIGASEMRFAPHERY